MGPQEIHLQTKQHTKKSILRMHRALFLLATCAALQRALTQSIPGWLTPCYRDDPEFSDCATQMVLTTLKHTIEGDDELGIEPIDPFFVPEVVLNYQRGPITSKINAKGMYVHGFKNIQIEDARGSVDDELNVQGEAMVKLPSIFVEGSYRTDSRIAFFPIVAKGRFNINATDISMPTSVEGSAVTKNGITYIKVQHVRVKPEIGDLKMYFDGLFGRENLFNDIAVNFANTFWDIYYREFSKSLEENFDRVLTDATNRYTLRLPAEKIFPRGKSK